MKHSPFAYALVLLALATSLRADPPPLPGTPMTPSEFSAYAVGRTLSCAADGAIWGQEHYLPNRQVMWAFTGEDCKFGQWYPEGNAVCFVYEGDDEPKCWNFYMGSRGLIAALIGSEGSTPLAEVGQSSQPMDCQGPQVGA